MSEEESAVALVTPPKTRYFKWRDRTDIVPYDYSFSENGIRFHLQPEDVNPSSSTTIAELYEQFPDDLDECDEHGKLLTQPQDQTSVPQPKPELPIREFLISESLVKVNEEVTRAIKKHGSAPWGRHEFLGILLEEIDEAQRDIFSDAPQDQLLKEVAQIAAVCVRYLETGDRYRGEHPKF